MTSCLTSEFPSDVDRGFVDRGPWLSAVLSEISGICTMTLNSRLQIVSADRNFLSQFSRPAQEMSGRQFEELLHPGLRMHIRQQLNKLFEPGGTRVDAPIVALRPDGSTFHGLLTGITPPTTNGAPDSCVVLVKPEGPAVSEQGPAALRPDTVTEVDARILEGVAAGMPSTRLATRLCMSRHGIEYRIGGMLRKFDVPNRSALVSRAYSLGILSIGVWPPQVRREAMEPGARNSGPVNRNPKQEY
jgi:DNA-binding CsgD family transcriptional regulator